MSTGVQATAGSKMQLWAGWIMSALPTLALLASAMGKLLKPVQVLKEFERLGYPESVVLGIGIVEMICAIIYAIPQTSVLGAILLTAYLGGATATHVRIGDPFFSPVIIGMLVWGGLYLRDRRIRALVPFRESRT